VNRYGIGNDDVLHYCEEEQVPLIAKIPNDRRIAELYSKGKLLYPEVVEVRTALEDIITNIQSLKEYQIS